MADNGDEIGFLLEEGGFFFGYWGVLCYPLPVSDDIGCGCWVEGIDQFAVGGESAICCFVSILSTISGLVGGRRLTVLLHLRNASSQEIESMPLQLAW